MSSIFRKLRYFGIATLFTLAVAAGGVGLAKASVDVSGGNEVTGPNSENENNWDVDQRTDIDIDNFAEAGSDYDLSALTGLGEIEFNTAVDDILTGDVWGDIEVRNELNNSDLEISDLGDFDNVHVTLENDTTGPFSENENNVDIDANRDIDISNRVDIDNDIDVCANTGDMEIGHNTVVGDIRTGSIRIDSNVTNEANRNMSNLNLDLGSSNVSAEMSNVLTGPNSENQNRLDVDNSLDLDVRNTANIDNDFDVKASTGGNEVENNTCVGDIETGSIFIGVNVSNTAN